MEVFKEASIQRSVKFKSCRSLPLWAHICTNFFKNNASFL